MCGVYHGNLDLIEEILNVSLIPKGNIISIKGKPENIVLTKNTLSKLYERAKDSNIIEKGDVEAVINFMKEEKNSNNSE